MHGCLLRGFEGLLRKSQTSEPSACAGHVDFLQSYGMQYKPENLLFGDPLVSPPNFGEISDEHGERIHQDILAMEKRHQGKWTSSKTADYFWTLKRDVPEANYRRNSYASTF